MNVEEASRGFSHKTKNSKSVVDPNFIVVYDKYEEEDKEVLQRSLVSRRSSQSSKKSLARSSFNSAKAFI